MVVLSVSSARRVDDRCKLRLCCAVCRSIVPAPSTSISAVLTGCRRYPGELAAWLLTVEPPPLVGPTAVALRLQSAESPSGSETSSGGREVMGRGGGGRECNDSKEWGGSGSESRRSAGTVVRKPQWDTRRKGRVRDRM